MSSNDQCLYHDTFTLEQAKKFVIVARLFHISSQEITEDLHHTTTVDFSYYRYVSMTALLCDYVIVWHLATLVFALF